jgi:hypothetical protein
MDLLVAGRGFNLIFELKRTFALYGLVQLGQLYGPLMQFALPGVPVFKLLVCKNLNGQCNSRYLVASLEAWFELVETALEEGSDLPILTLQWRP